jgi:hypothetical protein
MPNRALISPAARRPAVPAGQPYIGGNRWNAYICPEGGTEAVKVWERPKVFRVEGRYSSSFLFPSVGITNVIRDNLSFVTVTNQDGEEVSIPFGSGDGSITVPDMGWSISVTILSLYHNNLPIFKSSDSTKYTRISNATRQLMDIYEGLYDSIDNLGATLYQGNTALTEAVDETYTGPIGLGFRTSMFNGCTSLKEFPKETLGDVTFIPGRFRETQFANTGTGGVDTYPSILAAEEYLPDTVIYIDDFYRHGQYDTATNILADYDEALSASCLWISDSYREEYAWNNKWRRSLPNARAHPNLLVISDRYRSDEFSSNLSSDWKVELSEEMSDSVLSIGKSFRRRQFEYNKAISRAADEAFSSRCIEIGDEFRYQQYNYSTTEYAGKEAFNDIITAIPDYFRCSQYRGISNNERNVLIDAGGTEASSNSVITIGDHYREDQFISQLYLRGPLIEADLPSLISVGNFYRNTQYANDLRVEFASPESASQLISAGTYFRYRMYHYSDLYLYIWERKVLAPDPASFGEYYRHGQFLSSGLSNTDPVLYFDGTKAISGVGNIPSNFYSS